MMTRQWAAIGAIATLLVLPHTATATTVDTGATEGDTITFTVTLDVAPNGWSVRYKYKTKDRSAVQNEDYESTSGTVTFNSGVREQKIRVDHPAGRHQGDAKNDAIDRPDSG